MLRAHLNTRRAASSNSETALPFFVFVTTARLQYARRQ